VLREKALDPYAADIWSLAVCLYGLLTGHPLYSGPEDPAFHVVERGGVEDVLNCYEKHGLIVPPLAKHLICYMMNRDPSRRPTLEVVMVHPFLLEARSRSTTSSNTSTSSTSTSTSTCKAESSFSTATNSYYRLKHLLRLQ